MPRKSPTPKTLVTSIPLIAIMLSVLLMQIAASAASDQQLPIRRVVLYKHGVAYIERQGVVESDEPVQLHFRRPQMNDLLKSLTVLDLQGSLPPTVTYDSTRTKKELLDDFDFQLSPVGGLPGLLEQVRGTSIELEVGNEMHRGRVVTLEKRKTIIDDDLAGDEFLVTILSDQGRLLTFNTNEIMQATLLDPEMREQVDRYLEILDRRSNTELKTVTIQPQGSGPRQLLAGYITEAPVWKASYRLVLSEKDTDDDVYLQGWAIVDNVSSEDWQNVELALVSGLPVSFVQNLYDPLFKERPFIAMDQTAAVAPSAPEPELLRRAGRAMNKLAAAPKPMAQNDRIEMAADMAEESFAYGMGGANFAEQVKQIEAQTLTSEVGDLFEYRIDHPVTVERNRSAMLPIVASDVEGEEIYLYNEHTRAKNPLAAIRFENNTALTLEGGPITVLRGSRYVGEALLETIKPDEKRYLTYAVDLGSKVDTKRGTRSERVDRIVINRGTMRIRREVIDTKTYTFSNSDARSKTVVVEHPYRQGHELLEPKKPLEQTDNFYRFELKVPAGKSAELQVKEKRQDYEHIAITNINDDQLAIFIRKRYLEPQIEAQLREILEIKKHIVRVEQELDEQQKQERVIFDDQERLRNNLRALGQSSEERNLRSRYLGMLDDQESKLQGLRKAMQALREQRDKMQIKLNELIESLAQDMSL